MYAICVFSDISDFYEITCLDDKSCLMDSEKAASEVITKVISLKVTLLKLALRLIF